MTKQEAYIQYEIDKDKAWRQFEEAAAPLVITRNKAVDSAWEQLKKTLAELDKVSKQT